MKDFRKALQHERRCYDIFNELFGENDRKTQESNNFLRKFTEKAVQIEKESKVQQQKMVSKPAATTTRITDDDISSLPIRDIMQYINNSGRARVSASSFRRK